MALLQVSSRAAIRFWMVANSPTSAFFRIRHHLVLRCAKAIFLEEDECMLPSRTPEAI
jgi:hypothetical protein